MIENPFNQLTSLTNNAGVTRFSYDGRGNQIRKDEPTGSTAYQYDPRNVLTDITLPSGQVNHYGYDPAGLRVLMQDGQGNRRILLDGIEEYGEYDAVTGTQLIRYDHDLFNVDGLLAQVNAQGKHHFSNDALGSVYGVTSDSGNLASIYSYDVFGARAGSLEAIPTGWGFTGRRRDAQSGLNYHRERYLETSTGQWTQADPLAFSSIISGGVNSSPNLASLGWLAKDADALRSYRYVGQRPALQRDPSGFAVFSGSLTGAGQWTLSPTFSGPAVQGSAIVGFGIGDKGFTQATGFSAGFGIGVGVAFQLSLSLDLGIFWGLDTACDLAGPFAELAVDALLVGVSLVWSFDSKPNSHFQEVTHLRWPIGVVFSTGATLLPLPTLKYVVTYTTLKYANGCCVP